jgi:hypothetical protein
MMARKWPTSCQYRKGNRHRYTINLFVTHSLNITMRGYHTLSFSKYCLMFDGVTLFSRIESLEGVVMGILIVIEYLHVHSRSKRMTRQHR